MKTLTKKSAVKKIAPHSNEVAPPRRVAVLTERERDVLKLFSAGHTYFEIGEQLELSPKTVGSYLQRVREKYRAKSKADLITLALHEGLLKTKSK